jgi:hypothetical protein
VVCECRGNDLYCSDGTVAVFNPQCACHCEGTTLFCADGGSIPNYSDCKQQTTCTCIPDTSSSKGGRCKEDRTQLCKP